MKNSQKIEKNYQFMSITMFPVDFELSEVTNNSGI